MTIVPDAPWVREAMMFGVIEAPEVKCPVCGEEAEEVFVDREGEIVGCPNCVKVRNAYDEIAVSCDA